jgi:hypothetical protein
MKIMGGSMRMLTSPNSTRCMMVRVIVHNLPSSSIMESSKKTGDSISLSLSTFERGRQLIPLLDSSPLPSLLPGRIDLCMPMDSVQL